MGIEPTWLLVMSQPTDHWYEHPAMIIFKETNGDAARIAALPPV